MPCPRGINKCADAERRAQGVEVHVNGPLGIDKKNQAFVRPIDGGVQRILLAIVDREPELTLSLVLGCRLEAVEETFHRFSGSPPAAQGDTLTTMTQSFRSSTRIERSTR